MNTALTEKLTEPERRKFNDLDGIIRKGLQTFAEVGASLAIVRDQRLYREEYDSFEAYCQDRCGWGRDRAYQLIEAHDVVAGLPTIVGTEPPANEAQARALIDVPPEHRAEVLTEAQAEAKAEGKPVTAKRIHKAAERHAPRKPKAEPKSMAEQVADATERRIEEAKESDRRIAEARAKREAPEPTPVPNEPPVVVEGETEPEDGPVAVWVRALALPCFMDTAGMTDADAEKVAVLESWCGRILNEYRNRRHT